MRVETHIEIIEKEGYHDNSKVNAKWYVQKTECRFRKAALERLAKIGPFGEVQEIIPADMLGHTKDKQWGKNLQGLTFDEENMESNMAARLFKDKDQAKLQKLEKEKKDIGEEKPKKMTIGNDKRLQNSGMISFRTTDVYFQGDLNISETYKDQEELFRDQSDVWKKEVEAMMGIMPGPNGIKMRLNFRQNRKTNIFNGIVNWNFEDQNHANAVFSYIDGTVDFNNFVIRPEWNEARKF